MIEVRRIQLPLSADDRALLRAGDEVLLTGPCFTARDATMGRLVELVSTEGALPQYLQGHTLFFAGPTPPHPGNPGHPFGSIGPTTANRMDGTQIELMSFGLKDSLGKAARGEAYKQAAREHEAVFFTAIGGAAAVLARHVMASEVIAWPELGTEALMRLELEDFPAIVAIDAQGGDVYER